jgi:hypothetical protein
MSPVATPVQDLVPLLAMLPLFGPCDQYTVAPEELVTTVLLLSAIAVTLEAASQLRVLKELLYTVAFAIYRNVLSSHIHVAGCAVGIHAIIVGSSCFFSHPINDFPTMGRSR